MKYLFTSERLGFRTWQDSDLSDMHEISSNPVVMEFFPSTQNLQYVNDFIQRMKQQFQEKGYCYFAVERLDTGKMIGFIGLSEQHFESEFTPCIDIGWRIHPDHWNQGFATEGAKACLRYASEQLGISNVCAITPILNKKSARIMQKIGMEKIGTFQHPAFDDCPRLQEFVIYEIVLNGKNKKPS